MDKKAVGRRLEERRCELGIDLKVLARQVHATARYLDQLEKGHYTPGRKLIERLAARLETTVDYLMYGTFGIHELDQQERKFVEGLTPQEWLEMVGIYKLHVDRKKVSSRS